MGGGLGATSLLQRKLMSNRIQIVTTTSTIEGWTIEKYLGVVTYQIVIGANIFRDVFSSFRDVFGGIAKAYQKDLANMEEIAIENLKNKASKLGGNLILGLRLDFDEVSGGGKSMFMLSASGTTALGKPISGSIVDQENDLISFERLEFELERDLISKKVISNEYSIQRPNEIEELLEYRIEALEKVVQFIESYSAYFDESKDLLTQYFQIIPLDTLNNFIKSNLFLSIRNDTFYKFISLLSSTDWFDYEVIYFLLNNQNSKSHQRVLYLLEFSKNYLAKDDLVELGKIVSLLETVYQKYPITQTSKGMLGKEKTEWVCLNCGTKNPIESKSCQTFECRANVYGIPKNQYSPESTKTSITNKINKLKQLLNVT